MMKQIRIDGAGRGDIPERGRTPLGARSGALLGCRRGRTPPAPLTEMAGPKLFPPPDLLASSPTSDGRTRLLQDVALAAANK
jgi:hypothetical protein